MATGVLKTKICKECNCEKSTSEFHAQASSSDGFNSWCKSCRNSKIKEYRDRRRDIVSSQRKQWDLDHPGARKDYKLQKLYGMTLREFNLLWKSQNERCGFCNKVPTSLRLHVDHDHDTGKIRGILCSECNTSKVGSNTLESAYKLIQYLSKK